MAINFKSVGDLATDRKFQAKVNETPIGLKTPMQFGQSNDGIFAMHFSLANQIQDNIRNLILTNWGERLGFYDYGANLRELTFELTSDQFDTEAAIRIKRAVSRWMPFIELQEFSKEIMGRLPDQDVARVRMKITYSVPALGIANKGIEITFYIGG